MKKTKLIATIMTICLAISTLAYGVYAATNLSFTIGANIAFEVQNLFVQVNGTVNGAYSDTLQEQTEITNLNNIEIVHYDPTVVVSTINDWNVGTLYFNNSNVNETIDFVFTVVNHTPETTIGVDIVPDATTATAFENAELIITKTYANNKQTAANNETIVLTYSLKLSSLTNAVSINAINLNVRINKLFMLSFNSNGGSSVQSIQYTGTPIAMPIPTTEGAYVFDGWYKDINDANSKITWPYTPQSNETLIAKWAAAYKLTIYKETNGQIGVCYVTVNGVEIDREEFTAATDFYCKIIEIYVKENASYTITHDCTGMNFSHNGLCSERYGGGTQYTVGVDGSHTSTMLADITYYLYIYD